MYSSGTIYREKYLSSLSSLGRIRKGERLFLPQSLCNFNYASLTKEEKNKHQLKREYKQAFVSSVEPYGDRFYRSKKPYVKFELPGLLNLSLTKFESPVIDFFVGAVPSGKYLISERYVQNFAFNSRLGGCSPAFVRKEQIGAG